MKNLKESGQKFKKYDHWLEECVRKNGGRCCKVKGNIQDGATAYSFRHGFPLTMGRWFGKVGVVYSGGSNTK